MKKKYEIGRRVILSRECSCLAGIILEKGQEVTISEIDPMRGYGFVDDYGNRVIECGWDCIERAVDEAPSKEGSSLRFTEEELEQAKELALRVFKLTILEEDVAATLLNKFSREEVEFIIKGITGAFETGFDCCMKYVTGKED